MILRLAEENREQGRAAGQAVRAQANQQLAAKEVAPMDPLWRELAVQATEQVSVLPQEMGRDPAVLAEMARVAELRPRAMARAEVRPAMEVAARSRKVMAAAVRTASVEWTDREADSAMTRPD